MKFKLSIGMRKKGDVSDLECGMVVGADVLGFLDFPNHF